jgi:hypothetical protein
LFQNFGAFEYKHVHSVFIEKLLQLKAVSEKTMFVNVSKNNVTIAVLKEQEVFLLNSFSYETKEDFIYYILFTSEQLGLNTNEFPLFFTGAIEKESEIYKTTYQYVRNVDFLKSENPIFLNSDFPTHTNFILLG